jgi:hypothetical protein
VFVLKSVYNQAWLSFDVHELGRIVTEAWASGLDDEVTKWRDYAHWLKDDYVAGKDITAYEEALADESVVLLEAVRYPEAGNPYHRDLIKLLDVRKLGFNDRDWLVSRKRNRNLFDVVNMLRKSVLLRHSATVPVSDVEMDDWET